jgi:hypothetical protein
VLCGCLPQLQVAVGSDAKLQQKAVEMQDVAERRCGSAVALRTAGLHCSLPWLSVTMLVNLSAWVRNASQPGFHMGAGQQQGRSTV